jgi:hypothetical protein
MDQLKEAFQKVKKDIDSLRQELNVLAKGLNKNNKKIAEVIEKLDSKNTSKLRKSPSNTSTHQHIISTDSTYTSTHNTSFKGLKHQNLSISTGNEGVPTDKQTNRQTNQHIQKITKKGKNTIETATEILDSLDNIKKEIRLKFKAITEQEFLVFSTIYQLEEEKGYTDYKSVSQTLNLSESSIRDYVGRLIKKGIPVDKKKINNKNIQLSISQNLRKIAPLATILQLRGL